MKYVMFEQKVGTLVRKVPVIFPNEFVHANIAIAMKWIEMVGETLTPVSAGECHISCEGVHGGSETLKLKSGGKDDEEVINTIDYLHGL